MEQSKKMKSTLSERVDKLNAMIRDGKIIEAMTEFYADDVSMQENETPPTIGKSQNIEREKQFVSNVIEWRAEKAKLI